MSKSLLLAVSAMVFMAGIAHGQTVSVIDGQTSVLLDTDLLQAAAGLSLSGVSNDVEAGNLGDASVAFGINPRNNPTLPTTFRYTANSFAPFSGSIEHTGSVFFNADTIEVGNFSIGFDANRVMGDNSGFFVASTTGIAAILFDVANVSSLLADTTSLFIAADLAVSPEFANFLGNANLTGAVVGQAAVKGISIPEPSSALLLGSLTLLAFGRRR